MGTSGGFSFVVLVKDFKPNFRGWGSKTVSATMGHGCILTT